jgi:DNA adenine methylase
MGAGVTEPSRPALRWHGGKWLLAPWIISHFPDHRVYVEPFGGAGSVLLRKPRSYAEVWNDLDDDVVGFFKVLQQPEMARRLHELLQITPFARRELEHAWDATGDPVERARRLVIRSYMGFGSNAHVDMRRGKATTGFRANSNRSGSTPAHDWVNYAPAILEIAERFKGVIIEHRDALLVMRAHDSVDTLHYADPPYLPETRSAMQYSYGKKGMYRHELDGGGHVALLDHLRELRGMVILSGYPSPVYDAALPDWRRIERAALADGARPRVEVLWINPSCAAALVANAQQLDWLEAI